MKFGLTPHEYNYIINSVVEPLKKEGAVVWCYGSRARGDHKEFSDLDLMIESSQKNDALIGLIIEELENSNFPYKVDLVHFSDFADSYKKSYLNDHVIF